MALRVHYFESRGINFSTEKQGQQMLTLFPLQDWASNERGIVMSIRNGKIKVLTKSDKELLMGLSRLGVCTPCLLYTSDAADEEDSVDLGGRRIINKKKHN